MTSTATTASPRRYMASEAERHAAGLSLARTGCDGRVCGNCWLGQDHAACDLDGCYCRVCDQGVQAPEPTEPAPCEVAARFQAAADAVVLNEGSQAARTASLAAWARHVDHCATEACAATAYWGEVAKAEAVMDARFS